MSTALEAEPAWQSPERLVLAPTRPTYQELIENPLECEGDFFDNDRSITSRDLQTRIDGAKVGLALIEPEEAVDQTPLIVVQGMFGIKSAYQKFGEAVARLGKPVVLLEPARLQNIGAMVRRQNIRHPEILPSKVVWAAMREVQQTVQNDRFDAVGHSMGGFIVSQTAAVKPEAFRSIIFAGSAGLDGHNTASFIRRAPAFLMYEALPSISRGDLIKMMPEGCDYNSMAVELTKYLLHNPFRTAAEIWATTNCNIRPELERMQQEQRIKTALLLLLKDRLISPQLSYERAGHLFDEVAEMPNAGHAVFQTQPERTARAVVSLTQRLNQTDFSQAA